MDRPGYFRDMDPLGIFYVEAFPLSEGQAANLAEKVKLRACDGVVVEARTRAVMTRSLVLGDLIEQFGTDDVIPVPNVTGAELQGVVWCMEIMGEVKRPYPSSSLKYASEDPQQVQPERVDGSDTLNFNDTTKVNDQENRDYDNFLREVQLRKILNKGCWFNYDLKTIQRLHKTADYLNIPSLLHLTSTLIREAPSRAFMELVSPWVDYDSVEAYRNEVAAF